ncbi:uncharacterized protein K452DRAFT_331801 [Aplosporella prunicola CBS 121167]|uniref:Autophagy-related protein 13 n=1 Tax=Aplosporella prunicola CBS 121167 TaxID=1176127 RepID=A0A6A6AWA2_9PEZI|nr:uncharacterized protein K452DRAFT_331801 [Aplosporella prunicola CBS 121167]KAF2135538.1 hypothetical protein K452DRAFT_331801 [Aplosporella prunicola CBS 121167]
MHQHPRPSSARTTGSANSPRSNPLRPTSTAPPVARSDAGSDYMEKASDGGEPDYGETDEERTIRKLNQVIMQFFKKATLTILSARTTLPQISSAKGELRQSKWFSLVLNETDIYNEDLRDWTAADLVSTAPPPLCVEIYLDLKDLSDGEALAIIDEHGKLWDVAEALNAASSATPRPVSRSGRTSQVLLERWTIEVTDNKTMDAEGIRVSLPNVYKNAIALFRSLYTFTRFMPTWKYYRTWAKPSTHNLLPLKYRITNGLFKSPRRDTLDMPLYPAAESVAQSHSFDATKSPVGNLNISVQYRSNTDFRVEGSESVLSSHFMGMDEQYFSPSFPERVVPGSLPTHRRFPSDQQDVGQAYGSLSTFHQVGPPTGTSPISALRAARDIVSHSPDESPPQKIPPNHRIVTGSKSSLRGSDNASPVPRRGSVSFRPENPFKAGSLSSSPVPGIQVPPSPGTSLGRTSSTGGPGHTRNRSSLNALPQTALRTPSGHSLPNETAIASSASSSPKPAPISRYSGGGSKTEEDNSSGKGSASSSAQPLEGGSSGSVQTDEENISDFLKLLESKKDLKSLNRTDSASRDASMRRTTAALSKYQRMRDSNAALSDSISSSLLLHRSSSSSSRQLGNVPGMIGGASVSTSSSPGKPISPHTPHTPAIPSRLSANSIIDYDEPRGISSRDRHRRREEPRDDADSDSTARQVIREGTTAIDIPTSPRPWAYGHARRSSSVAQQQRNTLDEEPDIFGLRSASLPNEDRGGDLSLSELLVAGTPADDAPRDTAGSSAPDTEESASQAASNAPPSATSTRHPSLSLRTRTEPNPFAASRRGSSRYSFVASRPTTATLDDDEPLLFTMSELGTQNSRRSIDGRSSAQSDRRG